MTEESIYNKAEVKGVKTEMDLRQLSTIEEVYLTLMGVIYVSQKICSEEYESHRHSPNLLPCILIPVDTLSGSVERITFYNPENGYTVLRLRPEHQRGIHGVPKASLSSDGLATVVGTCRKSPGGVPATAGQWTGPSQTWLTVQSGSLRVRRCRPRLPGIQGYLGSA